MDNSKIVFDIIQNHKKLIHNIINNIDGINHINEDGFIKLMESLDNFMFISSLSLNELLSDKSSEKKNIVGSSHLICFEDGMESLIKLLKIGLRGQNYLLDIHIIKLSWVKTISLDEEITKTEIKFLNSNNCAGNIIIRDMSYITFFKNINVVSDSITSYEKEHKNFLGINPIFIFQGLSWSNIVLLFKINNMIINGGSISRRHKLSISEYRLGMFLYMLHYWDKSGFYNSYTDKSYTSPKIEDYYNDLLEYDNDNDIERPISKNPFVNQYFIINNTLDLLIKQKELEINISNIELEINAFKSQESIISTNIENIAWQLDSNKQKISYLKSKNVDNTKSKNKASIKGRIKNLKALIIELKSENEESLSKLSRLRNKHSKNLKLLENLKSELNLIKEKSDFYKSKFKVLEKNKIGNSYISNRREYHSISSYISNRREYHSISSYNSVESINKFNFNINSPVYIELQRIINNFPLDENTQFKIEEFLYNQGVILLNNRMNQNSDINYNKINPFVIEILKRSIDELSKLIDNYRFNVINIQNKTNIQDIVEYELLNNLSNDVIIEQLLGRLLRIISNHNLLNKNTNCTELAYDLGDSLLYSFYSQKYKKFNNSKEIGLQKFIDQNYSVLNDSITSAVKNVIGFRLLNFLEEVKLIHSELYIKNKDEKIHIYVGNNDVLENIGKSFGLLNISYKIPMIVPPKPYSKVNDNNVLGGYLLNDREYVSPLIIKNNELREQSDILEENIIYNTVNQLSSVGYKINIPVLDFILEKGLEYKLFTDPNFQHPLEIKQNKKLTLSEKKILDSFLSRKQLELNILGLATIFKNVPEFFIPVRIDNRGRIYCMVDYLNYQGIELSKALLLFSKGEIINKCDKQSIDYLKIFGGNCFGNGVDKKSYNDRINWVNENEENILNFRNGILIKEAESKLLFIAFCFEYANYHNSLFSSESSYISYFPIQLDATCNGYQHLSLLIGDEPLAGKLNLISGDQFSIPEDFYSFVGLKLNDYLNSNLSLTLNKKEEYLNSNKDLDTGEYKNYVKIIESCLRLIKLNKERSLVKTPIMVKPYNASLFTMIEYVKDNFIAVTKTSNNENNLFDSIRESLKTEDKIFFIYKNDSNVILTNYDFYTFVSTLEKVVYTEFPKLKQFNEYLTSVATICSLLNITITWSLPTGLNVNQYYVDTEAIRLKPFKYKKSTFNIKVKKNVINKSKQIRSLMPNLIHSLDASSLCLSVNMFYQEKIQQNKVFNFFGIHDCFAVTCNNVSRLIKIIKLVYIKIYTEDNYLRRFDQGVIDSIKLQDPENSFNNQTKEIKVNGHKYDYPDVSQVILGQIKACKINKAQNIIN